MKQGQAQRDRPFKIRTVSKIKTLCRTHDFLQSGNLLASLINFLPSDPDTDNLTRNQFQGMQRRIDKLFNGKTLPRLSPEKFGNINLSAKDSIPGFCGCKHGSRNRFFVKPLPKFLAFIVHEDRSHCQDIKSRKHHGREQSLPQGRLGNSLGPYARQNSKEQQRH